MDQQVDKRVCIASMSDAEIEKHVKEWIPGDKTNRPLLTNETRIGPSVVQFSKEILNPIPTDAEMAVRNHEERPHWMNQIIRDANKNAIRPGYYNPADPYEPRKVIRAWGFGWNLGNALAYMARAGKKDPQKHIEDLEKAIQQLQFEVEDLKNELMLAENEK